MKRGVVLLALAACGDNIEPDPNVARSGLRLKLVHYDHGDGTRETETAWFHDATRTERCTPRMWSDGVTLCTPDFTDTVFPTSDCDRALGRVPIGDATPPYFVRHYYLGGAWVPSRIYRPGEPADVPTYAWVIQDGACIGPYDTAGFTYFDLGAEVSRTSLARITHPRIPTTSRLALEVFASADGLYVPTGLRDRELDAPCVPAGSPGADSTVCVPEGVATAEYFHDAQCAEPELAVAFGDSVPPVVRAHDARSGCTSYHTLGSEVDAPPLYHRNGPSCVPIAAPTSNAYFLAGAPRELAALDRMQRTTTARLQLIDLVAGDLRIADALLHDTTLATACRRDEYEGALRCLPVTSIDVIELFGDPACQTIAPLAEVRTGPCEPPASFARAPSGAFHAIGAVHAGPLHHLSTGDRCLPYAIPEGISLHDIGPAVAAETFTAAVIVVDP